MADLLLPPEAVSGLRVLSAMSPTFVVALKSALAQQPPRLIHARFIEEIQGILHGEPKEQIHAVLVSLLSLSRGREELAASVSEFAREVAASSSMQLALGERNRLETTLVELLSLPALIVTAKASDLLTENNTNFIAARVVTDIRPAFTDIGEKPTVALIVHMLRIRVSSGQQRHDLHVALDEADIAKLQDVLARAQAKTTTIRRAYPELLFPVVTEEMK